MVPTVKENLQDMRKQEPSGEYCMAQHMYIWMKDVYDGKETYFAKPCETCKYNRWCYNQYLTNWMDLILPVLSKEGVSISIVRSNDQEKKPSIKEIQEDVEDGKSLMKGKFRPTGEYCMSRFFVRWYYTMLEREQIKTGTICASCPYWIYCNKHRVDFRDHIFPVIERELGKEEELEGPKRGETVETGAETGKAPATYGDFGRMSSADGNA